MTISLYVYYCVNTSTPFRAPSLGDGAVANGRFKVHGQGKRGEKSKLISFNVMLVCVSV